MKCQGHTKTVREINFFIKVKKMPEIMSAPNFDIMTFN